MLRYRIAMPPAPAIDDLATREVTITLNGSPSVQSLPASATEFTFDADRNVSVSIVIVDIDTSGNRSSPSSPLTFTTQDTVAPPTPGTPSVIDVQQV